MFIKLRISSLLPQVFLIIIITFIVILSIQLKSLVLIYAIIIKWFVNNWIIVRKPNTKWEILKNNLTFLLLLIPNRSTSKLINLVDTKLTPKKDLVSVLIFSKKKPTNSYRKKSPSKKNSFQIPQKENISIVTSMVIFSKTVLKNPVNFKTSLNNWTLIPMIERN